MYYKLTFTAFIKEISKSHERAGGANPGIMLIVIHSISSYVLLNLFYICSKVKLTVNKPFVAMFKYIIYYF